MEKYSVLGELLYIGFVCEKGRCKSSGIWKRSYMESVKKNVSILKWITECMLDVFDIENDNLLLRNICNELKFDKTLGYVYPFFEILIILVIDKNIITECKKENEHKEVIQLIDKMLDDISHELNKKFKKNKKLIKRLFFALHNLPRVYLNTDDLLRPSHKRMGIDSATAIEYCKSSMDLYMLWKYEEYIK